MQAALVIIKGPGAGTRFETGPPESLIGRAPESALRLEDEACGWRHCSIRAASGGFVLVDHRSPSGTLVNGRRVFEHHLHDGDQIVIGSTVLVFTLGAPSPDPSFRPALLRASTLLYLFRALATTTGAEQQARLRTQILHLVLDLTGAAPGSLILSRDEADIRQREAAETAAGLTAAPLYAHGALEGLLTVRFPPDVPEQDRAEMLGAIAALAAAALESAREVEGLQTRNQLLEERLQQVDPAESGIAGSSPSIHRLLDRIERVAPQDTTVLILGESGTGKELAANAIHRKSRRRDGPFVAINCAAITDTLLESELFGHEKGAFTGAVSQKKGKLELAEGGTVFLDEIGELAPALQAKLLRVLQQREFERVGGTRTFRLDVRLVAATNRDLAAEVRRGAFREDLFHRLNVIALTMPPLRERREDISVLARQFLERAAQRCGRRVDEISPEVESLLLAYDWPGNIRELENAIEHAVVLGASRVLQPEDLPENVRLPEPVEDGLTGAKREAIVRAWHQAAGDYKAAAAVLGVHPNSLLRMIRTLGLRSALRR